jgi:hypothetical protein
MVAVHNSNFTGTTGGSTAAMTDRGFLPNSR